MEKYKLLKDLPNAKAGEIFEYAAGKTQQLFSETSPATFSAQEIKEYDILNPDKGWFEKIEEKKYGGRVPKRGDKYWVVCGSGVIESDDWGFGNLDESSFECGSAFWTKEEAEKELARRKAYVILREDTKGFKPDWNNSYELKHAVYYDHDNGKFAIASFGSNQYRTDLFFATQKDAEASIKAHPSEWKTWLGIEE